MYTSSMRAQVYGTYSFNFTVALLFVLGSIYHLKDPQKPSTNFKIAMLNNNIQVMPNIDLTNDFKPGLKQIFLYAKMVGENREEMVWSQIVKRGDNKKIFRKFFATYRVKSSVEGCKFELWANHFPYVGIITFKKLGECGLN